jgi:hypothetical protein
MLGKDKKFCLIMIFATAMAFTACKSAGTKAGEDLCKCYSMKGDKLIECELEVFKQIDAHVDDKQYMEDMDNALKECKALKDSK